MGILRYFREKKAQAEREKAREHHWRLVNKSADMAISELVRDNIRSEHGYLYAADVIRVGKEHFNYEIPTEDADAALHNRLVFRGYSPRRFQPNWDYHHGPTIRDREPEPCDGFDYLSQELPQHPHCRRCNWDMSSHHARKAKENAED
ncbi:hypothetical protein ACVW0K_007154 [Streptomyces filamentosus]